MKTQKIVWCEGAIGFEHCGNCFKARVLDDAEMHRPASDGYVWVQMVVTPKTPIVGDAWVTEWPIEMGSKEMDDKDKFMTGF